MDVSSDVRGPPDRTRLASLSLHISAVLFVIAGLLLAMVPLTWESGNDQALRTAVMWVLAVLCIALAILAHILVDALRRRRRWAWMAAALLFALYLPSAFFPLGAVGLFGLMSKGTRAQFRNAAQNSVRHRC